MSMITLNDNQLKQLAEFTSNLGLVFFVTVITPIVTVDQVNPFMITLSVVSTAGCLFTSLWILRNI